MTVSTKFDILIIMSDQTTLLFTGGGTAGHCLPNIPLIERCLDRGLKVVYIGTHSGQEEKWVNGRASQFYSIASGKLRRYWSWQNIVDIGRILKGTFQAYRLVKHISPRVVFSKGGFLAVPVVLGAWLNRVPIVIHESDLTPGLANRICAYFADHLCTAFHDSIASFSRPSHKTHTGIPLRDRFYAPSTDLPETFPSPSPSKPRLVIFGGSAGARHINEFVHTHRASLTAKFQVIHIVGPAPPLPDSSPDYHPYTNINDHFANLLASAQLVICRSGANTLYELIALQCPHILIPLPATVSRGEQVQNANWAKQKSISEVIYQDQLTWDLFIQTANRILKNPEHYRTHMTDAIGPNSTDTILKILDQYCEV